MADQLNSRLSALDVSPVFTGSSPGQALRESVELAQQLEELGYHRFWVAEHHNIPNIASCSPSVLIGIIAASTSRLRVGSGGVMLANHSPLLLAEQFGTLEALHPGRIDLGIGRAPGADAITLRALRRPREIGGDDGFTQQLDELIGYFGDPADSRSAAIRAIPAQDSRPPIWLLGSSGYSAQLAGLLGFPFAFAHHFAPANAAAAIQLYRDNFRPSAGLDQPYAIVAANVIAADSDQKARWLAGPMALTSLLARTANIHQPHVTPEAAAERSYTPDEQAFIQDRLASHLVGGPTTLSLKIETLLQTTGANELMALTMIHSPQDRLQSYRILAETFGRRGDLPMATVPGPALTGSADRRSSER